MHIERFREGWIRKERLKEGGGLSELIPNWGADELLENAELVFDGRVTFAALILLGKKRALSRHLAHSEVVFEYRSHEGSTGDAQQKSLQRDGFLAAADALWGLVNKRNDVQPYQEGLFKYEVQTFDEPTIREAICNAVCHRDYRDQGSIYVRQYPLLFEVESPGGSVVPLDQLLTSTKPRNRRLAEAMQRCGLVERSGQGIDLMYKQCVVHARHLPDWSASDSARVIVRVRGEVTDAKIIRFFETVSADTLRQFSGEDFLTVDLVRRKQPLTERLRARAARLVTLGVLERVGGRLGLSRKLVAELDGEPRKVPGGGSIAPGGQVFASNLEAERQAVIKMVTDAAATGLSISQIMDALGKDRDSTRHLLRLLASEGAITTIGERRWARWVLPLYGTGPKVIASETTESPK